MKFSEVKKNIRALTKLFKKNKLINSVGFRNALQEMVVQDNEGTWWTVSHKTGLWHYYDGENWIVNMPVRQSKRLYTIYGTWLLLLGVLLLIPFFIIAPETQLKAYFILYVFLGLGVLAIISALTILLRRSWGILAGSIVCLLLEFSTFIFAFYLAYAFAIDSFRFSEIQTSDFYFLAYSPLVTTSLFIVSSVFAHKLLFFYENLSYNADSNKTIWPAILPVSTTIVGLLPIKMLMSRKPKGKLFSSFSLVTLGLIFLATNIAAILRMPVFFKIANVYTSRTMAFIWEWGNLIFIAQSALFLLWFISATVFLLEREYKAQ